MRVISELLDDFDRAIRQLEIVRDDALSSILLRRSPRLSWYGLAEMSLEQHGAAPVQLAVTSCH
jgi:hypothetical protein